MRTALVGFSCLPQATDIALLRTALTRLVLFFPHQSFRQANTNRGVLGSAGRLAGRMDPPL